MLQLALSDITPLADCRVLLRQSAWDAISDPVLVLDAFLCVADANAAALRLLGRTWEDVSGLCWMDLHPPLVEIGHAEILRSVLDGGGLCRSRIPVVDAQGGVLRLLDVTAYPIPQNDGCVTHLLIYAQDVSEEVRLQLQTVDANRDLVAARALLEEKTAALEVINARLEHIAVRDVMTDLPNHRAFQERMALEVDRAAVSFRPFSLLLFDVDDFKHYNDTFGHPQGDVLLARLALVIRSVVREHDLPARYGGEEFAVLLPDTNKVGAAFLAERLRAEVAAFPFPGCPVTVSVGVAEFGTDAADGGLLVTCADRAMYQAKADGKNRVCVWAAPAA